MNCGANPLVFSVPHESRVFRPAPLEIRNCGTKGRGVVATAPIRQGHLIEEVPVILLPDQQWRVLEQTALADYYYLWGQMGAAIALGYGSVYNHSYTPNARFVLHHDQLRIEFLALRDIETGEEVTVNYNGDPEDRDPLWFVPHDES
jgi:SET domain-containing protein